MIIKLKKTMCFLTSLVFVLSCGNYSFIHAEEISNAGYVVADEAFLETYDSQASEMRNSIVSNDNTIEPDNYVEGNIYYVSSTYGNDTNSGESPNAAWKTLSNVNNFNFQPGDVILFKRGDTFRGGIKAQTGVTYSAYGEGDKPKIYGSPENGTGSEKWTLMDGTDNIWVYYKELNDVGQIIFNEGESWAQRVYYGYNPEFGYATIYNKTQRLDIKTALDQDLKFFHCPDSSKDANGVPIFNTGSADDFNNVGTLYLRCDEGNPGLIYQTIEFCTMAYNTQLYTYGHIITVGYHVNNVIIDNLCLKYGSKHGIGGGDCYGLTVKNCEIGWIGGGIQYLNANENYKTVALGNGVEVVRDCKDYLVHNNWIYQCYDECITNQTTYNSARVVENVTYTNNLMEYSVLGISIWMTGSADMPEDYGMKNVRVEGNMFRYIGYSCFYEQRPNKNVSGAIIGGSKPAGNDDVVISNNVFEFSIKNGQMFRWLTTDESKLPRWDGNVYINNYGYNFGRCEVYTEEELNSEWITNFNSHCWEENIVDVIHNEMGDENGIIAIAFEDNGTEIKTVNTETALIDAYNYFINHRTDGIIVLTSDITLSELKYSDGATKFSVGNTNNQTITFCSNSTMRTITLNDDWLFNGNVGTIRFDNLILSGNKKMCFSGNKFIAYKVNADNYTGKLYIGSQGAGALNANCNAEFIDSRFNCNVYRNGRGNVFANCEISLYGDSWIKAILIGNETSGTLTGDATVNIKDYSVISDLRLVGAGNNIGNIYININTSASGRNKIVVPNDWNQNNINGDLLITVDQCPNLYIVDGGQEITGNSVLLLNNGTVATVQNDCISKIISAPVGVHSSVAFNIDGSLGNQIIVTVDNPEYNEAFIYDYADVVVDSDTRELEGNFILNVETSGRYTVHCE